MEDSIKRYNKDDWTKVFEDLLKEYHITFCPTEYLADRTAEQYSSVPEEILEEIGKVKPYAVYQIDDITVADTLTDIMDFRNSYVWRTISTSIDNELKTIDAPEVVERLCAYVELVESHLSEVDSEVAFPSNEVFASYSNGGMSILHNKEKRIDFLKLNKEELLATYPDMKQEDYLATIFDLSQRIACFVGKPPQDIICSLEENLALSLENLAERIEEGLSALKERMEIYEMIFAENKDRKYMEQMEGDIYASEDMLDLITNTTIDYSSIDLRLITDTSDKSTSSARLTFAAEMSLQEIADLADSTALRYDYEDFSQLHKAIRVGELDLRPYISFSRNMYVTNNSPSEPNKNRGQLGGYLLQEDKAWTETFSKSNYDTLSSAIDKYAGEKGTSKEAMLDRATEKALYRAAEQRNCQVRNGEQFFTGETLGELGVLQIRVGRYERNEDSTVYFLYLKDDQLREIFERNREIGDGFFKDYDELVRTSDITIYVSAEINKKGEVKFAIVQESDDYGYQEFSLPLTEEEKKDLSNGVKRMEREFHAPEKKTKRLDDIDDR